MKELILMRHGNAESPSFGTNDFDRDLTSQGRWAVESQAKIIVHNKLIPHAIISSNAKRARTTAEIMAYQLGITSPLDSESWLYHDFTTNDFLNWLAKSNNKLQRLLIIGHNPTISNIAYRLSKQVNFGFNPATWATIGFHVNQWEKIEPLSGELLFYSL